MDRYYYIFLILFFLFFSIFLSCDSTDVPEEGYIYAIRIIDGKPIDEFISKSKDPDVPLKIQLKYYNRFDEGSVVFKNLGKRKIDRKGYIEISFIIDINNEIEGLRNIYFGSFRMDGINLKGIYGFDYKEGDTYIYDFESTQIK